MQTNHSFYLDLPILDMGLTELLSQNNNFYKVPKDWHIVVVDIESSTQAVKHKLHHPVNRAASKSISAVLNEINSLDKSVDIPYFFGGDGVTFLVPQVYVQQVCLLLEIIKNDTYMEDFLMLRVGSIEVGEVNKKLKSQLRISKLKLTEFLVIPIVFGNALKEAERIIKSDFTDYSEGVNRDMIIDSSGCICTWKEIVAPPDLSIFCFNTLLKSSDNLIENLSRISKALDTCFGSYLDRLPISKEILKETDFLHKMHQSINKNKEDKSLLDAVSITLGSISDKLYKNTESFDKFSSKFRLSSLALSIDGSYNDIVMGTKDQIQKFKNFIENIESSGEVIFGFHETTGVVLSCCILQNFNSFVQFVDASDGGYSKASEMLKLKNNIL